MDTKKARRVLKGGIGLKGHDERCRGYLYSALDEVDRLQAQLDRATKEGCAFARELGAMTIAYEQLNATIKLLRRPHTDTMASVDETCRAALGDRMDPDVADALVGAVSEFVLSHVNASAYYREQLDRATKPRPMDEAPREREFWAIVPLKYDSSKSIYKDTTNGNLYTEDDESLFVGWFPLPEDNQ